METFSLRSLVDKGGHVVSASSWLAVGSSALEFPRRAREVFLSPSLCYLMAACLGVVKRERNNWLREGLVPFAGLRPCFQVRSGVWPQVNWLRSYQTAQTHKADYVEASLFRARLWRGRRRRAVAVPLGQCSARNSCQACKALPVQCLCGRYILSSSDRHGAALVSASARARAAGGQEQRGRRGFISLACASLLVSSVKLVDECRVFP